MAKRFTTGIAEIESRYILWQRIRYPLAVGVVLVLLVVSGLLLWSFIVSRGVRHDLSRATNLESIDTFESHREALALLESLRAQYPDSDRVKARLAWQRVLWALRYGATDESVAAATREVEGLEAVEASCLRTAARAGLLVLQDELDQALESVGESPSCREGLFVRAVAEARRGRVEEALVLLDRARRGEPPFAPALGELVRILREHGRFREAQTALDVLSKVAPGHEDGAVQGVLLALDQGAGSSAELSKQVGSLSARLSALKIGDDAPRTLAQERYAAGRLAYLRGDLEEAEAALTDAASRLSKSQPVARWLAATRRKARQYDRALAAIEAFPDEASTSRAVLETRLAILLELARANDARRTLAVLEKVGGTDLTAFEARLARDGATADRVRALTAAYEKGDGRAGLDAAYALYEEGETERARGRLAGFRGSVAEKACAAGIVHWLDGETAKARRSFSKATKNGSVCGARFAGRLLIHAGVDDDSLRSLRDAVTEQEDLLDRVLLARMVFRTDGAAAARRELERVEAAEPQAAAVLHDAIEAWLEMGRRDDAARLSKVAVQRTSYHPLVASIAARVARETKRLDDAEQILAEGSKRAAKAPRLLIEKAALLVARGRFAEAEEVAEGAMRPGPFFGDAACLRANAQLRRGDREAAQVELRRSLAPARRHSGGRMEAEIWRCLVDFHLQRGPTALTRAKTAMFYLRRIPVESATVEYLDGRVARRDNRPNDSEARYRKAISLDPAHRDAWRRLARAGRLTAAERARFEKLFPGQQPQDR